ncbi:MAG: calcium-binding protein, partial [Verrucomicrobiota bacterium]
MIQMIVALALFGGPAMTQAQLRSLCAEVQLQIVQEATLERQAFDAELRINNGLPNLALSDVNVSLKIQDADGNNVVFTDNPNDTNALFFVTVAGLQNIANINGAGTVAASTTAKINWLLVPAPGAAGMTPLGKKYFVGADFTYSLNGRDQSMRISSDQIFVRPQPSLILDYFLPGPVFADDAFTAAIEPSVPFPLGLRVQNNGFGNARTQQIDSGQPEIRENEVGFLIGC